MTQEKIQFEEGEVVLMRVRKHWFVLLSQLGGLVLAALLPLFFPFFFDTSNLNQFVGAAPGPLLITLYSAWLIMIWMALFSVWTNYYLDVWTVTNMRLIVVDQKGFFVRRIASFRLERLQDILVSVEGIIPTMLNYGSLEIQTAGNEQNFKASGLPNPAMIKAAILSSAGTLLREETPRTAL